MISNSFKNNKKKLEEVKDELALNTTVTFNNDDAMDLWVFLRDALVEDRKGKDTGRGGFIPHVSVFKLLRCLERLAIGIDAHRDSLPKKTEQESFL